MISTITTACWEPTDPELERLRQLERQANIDEEKRRIRERLWRRGINPDYPCGIPPYGIPSWPRGGVILPRPTVVCTPTAPSVEDILRRVR